MDNEPSKADVEARLRQTAETMSDRMESIQEEVSTTGLSIRDWMAKNPLQSVGGMLAAGLAVGFLFGGHRSGASARQTHRGEVPLEALREATGEDEEGAPSPSGHRAPFVIYTGDEGRGGSSNSLIRDGVRIVFRTGLSLLARDVIESVLADFDVEDVVDNDLLFD